MRFIVLLAFICLTSIQLSSARGYFHLFNGKPVMAVCNLGDYGDAQGRIYLTQLEPGAPTTICGTLTFI